MAGVAKTHEWYIERLRENWGDEYICLGEYKGVRVSIDHMHVPCGTVKPIRPDKLLSKNKRKCIRCTRKTHEQFVEEVKKIHGDRIKVIGKYTLAHERIEIIHTPCGHVRTPFANALLAGYEACRPCSLKHVYEKATLSQEEFEERIRMAHGEDIVPLGKYNGIREEVEFLHVACGRTWTAGANNVMRGHGCRWCAIDSKRLTDDKFKKKLHEVYQDEVEWIDGKYRNRRSLLKFRNNKCNHEFERMVDDMLNPHRRLSNDCPRCSVSKGEYRIEKVLIDSGLRYKSEYKFDDCRNVYPLPFDFAIIDSNGLPNTIIEFDGQEHYEPVEYFGGQEKFEARQKNDKIKNDYCEKNGIKLIRIPYWDYDNIETILERELGLVPV